MRCPNTAGCPLYPLFTMRSSLRFWQAQYCDGPFERCARYQVRLTGTRPAPNLLPNGRSLEVAAPQVHDIPALEHA